MWILWTKRKKFFNQNFKTRVKVENDAWCPEPRKGGEAIVLTIKKN